MNPTSEFNKQSHNLIEVVFDANNVRDVLEQFERWGFTPMAVKDRVYGDMVYTAATLEMPEGWRKSNFFNEESSTNIEDEKGRNRVTLFHGPMFGSGPERYGIRFDNRFALNGKITKDDGTPDPFYQQSYIEDQLTGDRFLVDISNSEDMKLDFMNAYAAATCDAFGVPNTPLGFAAMWDLDLKLTQHIAEEIRIESLDKLYVKQINELRRKRDNLRAPL